ncbi:hypothetical protein ABE545_23370 [Sphingobacterium faecium]|uniref:hypothetical protein n=1 Tax=Sphingobacterium faecium TaxID=34087 RepID=UPI003208EA79
MNPIFLSIYIIVNIILLIACVIGAIKIKRIRKETEEITKRCIEKERNLERSKILYEKLDEIAEALKSLDSPTISPESRKKIDEINFDDI